MVFGKQISGQDKPSLNATPASTPTSNFPGKPRSHPVQINDEMRLSPLGKFPAYPVNHPQGDMFVAVFYTSSFI